MQAFGNGCLGVGSPVDNEIKFKMRVMQVDPEDHSRVQVNVVPFLDGEYWVHVFLGNEELRCSPVRVRVIKSEAQRSQEALQKLNEDMLRRRAEEKRLERLRQLEAQKLKKRKAEEEKARLQREREEELERRRIETEKRAAEIMRRAKEAREKEERAKEEERRYQKEMRTGGGFNLKKH
jgi:hypothetical protein